MSMFVCATILYSFTIEYFFDMKEVEALVRLFEHFQEEESYECFIEKNREFEQFLSEMKITVEKKTILISREDNVPQTICLNC